MFQTVSSFLNKYKKTIKNKVETLFQQNPLLYETDLYENDDPTNKRIPQQNSQSPQSSPIIHTLRSEDILTDITNSSFDDSPQTNVITQTPIKPTSTQSLPFSTPPFLLVVKLLKTFSSHPPPF